jgi:hypothetical protein
MSKNLITIDDNEAAASLAFRVSETIAIFPIIANESNSLEEMRGNMSFQRTPNPAVYGREMFREMFAVRVGAKV